MSERLCIVTVIVNYKTYRDLSKCLAALAKQKGVSAYRRETIIIDSEYDMVEIETLQKQYPSHQFILQDQSYGVSANFNRGFRKGLAMGADYLLMVTPDVYLQPNVLQTLVDRMQKNSRLGAVTSKTLLPTNPPTIYFVGGTIDPVAYTTNHIGYGDVDKGQYAMLDITDFLNCAFVLIRASVFEKVGFWEPSYFLCYEDADWTVRLMRAGYLVEVVQSVFAWHDESRTVGKKSMQQEYFMARNHLLFVKRNASFKHQVLAYLFILKKSLELLPKLFLTKERRRAYTILLGRKDFLIGRFGYRQIRSS